MLLFLRRLASTTRRDFRPVKLTPVGDYVRSIEFWGKYARTVDKMNFQKCGSEDSFRALYF